MTRAMRPPSSPAEPSPSWPPRPSTGTRPRAAWPSQDRERSKPMQQEPEREDQAAELELELERRRGRGGRELAGAILYAGVTLAVSYFTMHPEELRDLVRRLGGR